MVTINDKAARYLVPVITGDMPDCTYRKGHELVDFFNRHGETDLYGVGFPSRQDYVRQKVDALNGTDRLDRVIEAAFEDSFNDEVKAENAAFQFTKLVVSSGIKLAKERGDPVWWNDEWHDGPLLFRVVKNPAKLPEPPPFLLIQATLKEHVRKAQNRSEQADYSGAITICYTLIEDFLKLALRELGIAFGENEGDINKLYRTYTKGAGLEVSETTPKPLKPLLSGLTSLIVGFYEVANKGSDRHEQKFKPTQHHAKLVISLTFAFCEFLIESREQRRRLREQRA